MRKALTADVCLQLLAATLLFFTGTQAEARWHLDIQGGAFIPTHDIKVERGGFDVELDGNTGAAFTIGGGYDLGRWVDFTAQFQTATNFRIFDDFTTAYSLTAGGRFFPLPASYPVRPWVGTQIGWYHVVAGSDDLVLFAEPDDSFSKTADSFGLNVGGGLDIPVNQRVSLGVDVRYHNAFDAFHGIEFVTTMFNVSIWFGDLETPRAS